MMPVGRNFLTGEFDTLLDPESRLPEIGRGHLRHLLFSCGIAPRENFIKYKLSLP